MFCSQSVQSTNLKTVWSGPPHCIPGFCCPFLWQKLRKKRSQNKIWASLIYAAGMLCNIAQSFNMFEGGWCIGVGSEGRGKTSQTSHRRTGLVLSPSTTRVPSYQSVIISVFLTLVSYESMCLFNASFISLFPFLSMVSPQLCSSLSLSGTHTLCSHFASPFDFLCHPHGYNIFSLIPYCNSG